MKKKRRIKKSKIRLSIFILISLCVIIYFFSILFSYTYNIYRLKKEEKELQIELASLEHEEKILKTNIEKLKDPDYIAKYAREYFQYSKDGEIILKVNNSKEEEKNKPNSKFEYKLILEIGTIILIIIVIYVILKNKKLQNKV